MSHDGPQMPNILQPTAHLFPFQTSSTPDSLYLVSSLFRGTHRSSSIGVLNFLSEDTYTKHQQFFSLPSVLLSKPHVFHFSSDKCKLFYNSLTLRISVRRAHRFLPGTTHQFVRTSYYSDYDAVLGPALTCHVLSEALCFPLISTKQCIAGL